VGTDPNPNYLLTGFSTKGAIVISDANAEVVFASLQAPESESGVMRIMLPQAIVLNGETLNFSGQRLEQRPEPPAG
jgi:hypothetical protein